jgi:MoxR-like ATPase
VDIHYPDFEAERQIILRTTGTDAPVARQVLTADDLVAAQRLVRQVPVGESVVNAILKLVRSGRPETTDLQDVKDRVAWGPGPRASQALMQATRARALLQGRLAPSVDDVIALAKPVLQHRMALNFGARADGHTVVDLIDVLCKRIDAG